MHFFGQTKKMHLFT